MATNQFVGTATEAQRLANESAQFKAMALAVSAGLRVAMPGVIASFNADTQTCTVDVAVQDKIKLNGVVQDKAIPTLLDVPLVIPRAGGYSLTLPVKAGDECLVMFGDMCIDSWWDGGGINNVQNRLRRHDLSDAFAVLAPTSQPRKLANYSITGAELRNDDRSVFVGIEAASVSVTAPAITAKSSAGAANALVNSQLIDYINTVLRPALSLAGINIPAPPSTVLTTVFKAE